MNSREYFFKMIFLIFEQQRQPGFKSDRQSRPDLNSAIRIMYIMLNHVLCQICSIDVHFHDPVTILPKTCVALKFMALPCIPLS